MTAPDDWLPEGFVPPAAVTVPYGHRLRPACPSDLARLLVADPGLDAGSGERRLAAWLAEMSSGTAFTYLLVDTDETAVLGGVRIAPRGASWCIVEECRGTDLAAAFEALVAGWLAAHWPAGSTSHPPRSGTPSG